MVRKIIWVFLVINVILVALCLFLIFGRNQNPTSFLPGDSLQRQLSSSIAKTQSLVVQVVAESPNSDDPSLVTQKTLLKKGSGIIVSQKGYLITNNHVVDDVSLKYSIITFEGKRFPVKSVWKDPLLDIAVLWVDTSFPTEATFLTLDTSPNLGQFVFAIGNPLSEYPNTVSFGIISGKGRNLSLASGNTSYYGGLYQTDVALNPGNSGGPLISLSGDVLGIITAISRGGNNIGFALPLSRELISATLKTIQQNRSLVRPYLGILYTDTSTGARVDSVFIDSPFQGQLLPGDVIVELDNRPLSSEHPLLYYLYTYIPGDTVIFSIQRQGSLLSLPLVLGQSTL